MDTQTGGAPPPDSKDLDGWRKVIAEDRLKLIRPEAIAAAFQDLGKRDAAVHQALAKHLSDVIVKILKKRVAFTRHDREDIILRVHGEIWKALLQPNSRDGRGLRLAFGSRVIFRMIDGIAKEQRESRVDEEPASKVATSAKDKDPDHAEVIDIEAAEVVETDAVEAVDFEESKKPTKWDASLLQNVKEMDERINVESILARIPNDRKRLAFRLYMDGVPFKSKSTDVPTIAKAVGVSERTARAWIEEVQTLLKNTEGVTHLVTMRGGR